MTARSVSILATWPLGVALLAAACAPDAGPAHPAKQIVGAGESPLSVFSPGVRAGGFLFVSGQIGAPFGSTELVPGGVGPQTAQALVNVGAVLERAGLGYDDVVKCTVYLASIEDYDAMNEVYRGYFPRDPPARSTLAASGLALGAAVEIECIALVSEATGSAR